MSAMARPVVKPIGERMKSPKPQAEPASAAGKPVTPSVAPSTDVALIHGVGEDGAVHVIRRRGDQLEAGALQPVREGAPIHGEIVSLRPREDFPLLCDVDVHYAPAPSPRRATAPPPARRKGPAQVATDTYRDNWDSIWSQKKSDALN